MSVQNQSVVTCEHKDIVLVNSSGEKKNEMYFVVRCDNCNHEFLNLSERNRNIINLSKH